MRRHIFRRHVRGLSLVELLISITLGAVILTAVGYVFSGSRASYRQQEELSVVQEAGRIAMELIARDLRMAGFTGCGSLGGLQFQTPALYANNLVITGGANQLTVRGGGAVNAFVVQTAGNTLSIRNALALGIAPPPPAFTPAQFLVNDCTSAEVFTATNAQNFTANLNGTVDLTAAAPFVQQYRADAMVMPLLTVAYSVDPNGQLIRNLNGTAQPIVGGVRIGDDEPGLTFAYGIDTNGDRSADQFVTAIDPSTNATQVVAVRVNLTILEGSVEQTFSSTITLRNRTP